MTDRPLHVRVAEALGWRDTYSGRTEANDPYWYGRMPDGMSNYIPRYDTDWAATGPLIERFGLSVRLSVVPYDSRVPWVAWAGPSDVTGGDSVAHGETPILALCNLILALHAAGKLPKEKA